MLSSKELQLKVKNNLSDWKSGIFSYTMDYDECTVMTEMPLSNEVADFIEKGLHRDMTDKDVIEWCDDNLEEIAKIYEKYRGTYLSYKDAEMTLFFTQTVHWRDDYVDMIRTFVACN